MDFFISITFCLIPAVIALYSIVSVLPSIRRHHRLLCWPRVIAKFKTDELSAAIPDPYPLRPAYEEFYPNYFRKPYIYFFNAWRFEGSRILKNESIIDRNIQVKKYLNLVQEAPSFLIYVNPNNPAESFLDPGDGRLSWKYLFFNAALIFVSFLLLLSL